ncbi:MAG: hypothetical protein KatS3mg011_2148 [Acidimicrobiia bacterium]|nr:MAG: hypothetical protein KatS3mg011_2148 [Acidimicrobiia bacterium]
MKDYASRFADLLEEVVSRIRQVTVLPAEKAIRVVTFAMPALVLAVLAVVFLFLTVHAALAIPLGEAAAYGIVGGVFLVAGVLVWRKRT